MSLAILGAMLASLDLARDVPLILALVVLVALALVLGAAEAALIRVNRVRVEVRADDGSRRAARLLEVLDDLPRVLNSVLLTVLLVQIGAATVTGILADRWFGTIGVTIGSVVLTIVLFVYTEAIPKTYAVRNPMQVAFATSGLVRVISVVLRPLVTLLVWFADLQAPGEGIVGTALDEAELLRLAAQSEAAGTIDSSDRQLMEAAFRFGDMRVDELLVPRPDVVAVRSDTDVAAALAQAIDTGHRRLPIHEGDLDGIVGVVRLRDLAHAALAGGSQSLSELMKPVLTVPETKRVAELLPEMQRRRLHLAVVVDEYGGTAGIVTIEDVVEEVLGDVADEDEPGQPLVTKVGDRRWQVVGGCPVDELERAIGVGLPDGEWRTVAGLVLGVAGRIPSEGESVEIAGLRITVIKASATRIRLVTVSA